MMTVEGATSAIDPTRKKRPPKGPEGHSLSGTSPENARRKLAACEALLAAVKIALSSSLRREIHEAIYSAWRNSPVIPRWAHKNAAVNSAINSSAAYAFSLKRLLRSRSRRDFAPVQ